jgi:hypothetical protein
VGKQYEVECGHCGYQFTLDGAEKPRSVKCAVCGGALTIAYAIPTEPEKPPAPPPPHGFPSLPPLPPRPGPPPILPVPARPVLDFLPLEFRAGRLVAPWAQVYRALHNARVATDAAFIVYLLGLCLIVLGMPIFSGPRSDTVQPIACLVLLLVIPVITHAGYQLGCGSSVPQAYGGRIALLSAGLFWSIPLFTALVLAKNPVLAVGGSGGLFLASSFIWLWFLRRFGKAFAEVRLVVQVWTFTLRYCVGMIVAGGLVTLAALASEAGSIFVAWVGQSLAGVAGAVLLREYSALLRLAAETVARRAPIAVDD